MIKIMPALLMVITLIFAPHALSHRTPELATTISWNERSQLFEVTHRLHQHDGQALLKQLDNNHEGIATLKSRAQIALIIAEHFSLSDKNNGEIPLTLVGAAIEDDYLLIYQEFKKPESPAIQISMTLYELLSAKHLSTVYIGQGKNATSYQFTRRINSLPAQLY